MKKSVLIFVADKIGSLYSAHHVFKTDAYEVNEISEMIHAIFEKKKIVPENIQNISFKPTPCDNELRPTKLEVAEVDYVDKVAELALTHVFNAKSMAHISIQLTKKKKAVKAKKDEADDDSME